MQGVGLGLYICRRLVRAHGTELTVSSEPGKGSIFGFELRLDPRDQDDDGEADEGEGEKK